VFVNYPIPHPPMIWDAKTNSYSERGSYDGNLKLADKSLAELRAAIEGAGLWDRTALLLLSDHPHRHQKGLAATPLPSPRLAPGEPRPVPMILRLPGNGAPGVDPLPVQTISLHDLAPEILEGRIKTLEQAQAWFALRSP
jgi:arylsulfatase A-like enzyme